jgi:hypothetical protein
VTFSYGSLRSGCVVYGDLRHRFRLLLRRSLAAPLVAGRGAVRRHPGDHPLGYRRRSRRTPAGAGYAVAVDGLADPGPTGITVSQSVFTSDFDSPDSAHVWELPTHCRSLMKRPASHLGGGPFGVLFTPVTRGRKWVSASYALVRGHCSNPVTDLYPVDGSRRRLAGQSGRRALLRHPQRELGGRWASVEQARLAVAPGSRSTTTAAALRHRLPQPHRLREDHRTPAAGRRMKPGVHPWGTPTSGPTSGRQPAFSAR